MNDNPTVGAQSVEAFAKDNDIGRTTVYQEMKKGRLRTFKVGRRRLISGEAGAKWRRKREEETAEREA